MSGIYEEPWTVNHPDECWFYHKVDLPGFGTLDGQWDIRGCAGAYLGNHDFTGKRVLDIGTASGFLTFEMERRGAEVVSFDMDDAAKWHTVPHFRIRETLPGIRSGQGVSLERMKKGYWLTHRLLASKARAHYGDLYALDDRLGEFDVVYYGMIVGHLRDVFQALYQGARRCRETMIVTSIFEANDTPRATFIPRSDRWDIMHITSWWSMTTGLMKNMLGVLGFQITDIVESEPLVAAKNFQQGPCKCQAIVARRMQ